MRRQLLIKIATLANDIMDNFPYLHTGAYREQLRRLLAEVGQSGLSYDPMVTAELNRMRDRILTRLGQIQVGPNLAAPGFTLAVNEMIHMLRTFRTWVHPQCNGHA